MIRLQHLAGELLQIEILLVGGVVRSDDSERAALGYRLFKLASDGGERLRPGDLFELAIDAHQRGLQAVRVIVEIEAVTALDAQELAVDAGMIAIIAADDAVVAGSERSLA